MKPVVVVLVVLVLALCVVRVNPLQNEQLESKVLDSNKVETESSRRGGIFFARGPRLRTRRPPRISLT